MHDEAAAPTAGDHVAPVEWESLVLVASRAAVTRMAPQELEAFDAVATAWRSQVDNKGWSTPGASVGFGIDSALVTELVMQATGAAIGEVFSIAASRARSRWRRWRSRRKGGRPAGDTAAALWSVDNEARLREATQRHAIALGLSAAQARLLADAVVGALRSSAGQPPSRDGGTAPPVGESAGQGDAPQPVGGDA